VGLGVGPDEKIFTTRDERGFLPHTPQDNARFLKVLILFSQHEHRILTGQKPYFKRVLPLFSKP